jgi:polysaccharide export outer membrane protein
LHGYLIDADGNIEFPVVGKVKLGGLTIYEAEQKIQELAGKYLEEPVVRVRLVNYRFTVLGEVSNERSVNTFNNRISILEAIGLAGGLDELADRSNVKVIRQYENGVSAHYVNLLKEDLLIESPFYYVHQNDVIIVPPLKQRPFRRYFGQNLALIISSLSLVVLVLNLVATTR